MGKYSMSGVRNGPDYWAKKGMGVRISGEICFSDEAGVGNSKVERKRKSSEGRRKNLSKDNRQGGLWIKSLRSSESKDEASTGEWQDQRVLGLWLVLSFVLLPPLTPPLPWVPF